MKELVVVSGKGGTGKTSIVASFAALADNKVLADCDVDAADLHLVLAPTIRHQEKFIAGKSAGIIQELCTGCGECAKLCAFDAVREKNPNSTASFDIDGAIRVVAPDGSLDTYRPIVENKTNRVYEIDSILCEGCGLCAHFCPEDAIELSDCESGEWFVSDTRFGPMVHARLGIGEENSGKLVTLVRNEARKLAEDRQHDLIVVDGPPGIGCPVIASVAAADLLLIVTEPTLSGLHDLDRIAKLAAQLETKALICINKWDINDEITSKIDEHARTMGLPVVGRVRYDTSVTEAQIEGLSVIEYTSEGITKDIELMWERVLDSILTQKGEGIGNVTKQ
jgi:MinD superfamily P-loop ATPase